MTRIKRLPKAANGCCLTVISSFACHEHSFFSSLSIDYFECRSTFRYFFILFLCFECRSTFHYFFILFLCFECQSTFRYFFVLLFRLPKHFSLLFVYFFGKLFRILPQHFLRFLLSNSLLFFYMCYYPKYCLLPRMFVPVVA